jgi:hypothetical protein
MMRNAAILTILAALTVAVGAQPGFAQPADELKALRKEVEDLDAKQKENWKQVREIKTLLGAVPKQEEVRPPASDTRPGGTAGGLDDRQRADMVRVLAAQPKGTPVWFAVYEQDPAARDLGRALQSLFGEAGWVVRGTQAIPFTMKPGVYLFAADEEPPAYVRTVHEALGLAGVAPTVTTGYRAYYGQMRTKPGWQGFEMAPDQTYLVVIGPTAQSAGATTGSLDDRQRADMVRALAAQPKGTPVWLAVYEQDPAAREFSRLLQAVFGEAGWVVRGRQAVPFTLKPGVFLLVADAEPPAYVQTVHEALGLAGVRPTVGTGYRAYYQQMVTKPGWRGFPMAPDQTYLVVIGPSPQGGAAPPTGPQATTQGKSRFVVLIFSAAVLLTAVGGGAWYFYFRPRPTAEAEPQPEAEAPPPS